MDLRSIMAEYDQPFKKKYEEIIDGLKAENKELKQHEQKVNNMIDDIDRKLQKMAEDKKQFEREAASNSKRV